jgi:hypothetical protein
MEAERTLFIPQIGKIEAEGSLFIPQIQKIEGEQTMFFPQIWKIEAKWSLFTQELKKIEAKQTRLIPEIGKIEEKKTDWIKFLFVLHVMEWGIHSKEPMPLANVAWARICKRLRNPGIDSEELIRPNYVTWRASTTSRVVVPARPAGNRFRAP